MVKHQAKPSTGVETYKTRRHQTRRNEEKHIAGVRDLMRMLRCVLEDVETSSELAILPAEKQYVFQDDRVWLSARPEIFKISAIHEPVAFSLLSLRSRQILHTLNLREAQSARSNILEQTITSSPQSQQRRLYLHTEHQASR